ncbi:MAG TPA: cysteine synthase family protein [Bacillota bacterium]|nr:cysteine synthase family protein [Bacillota bacterium]HOH10034.1 cysteine synthase family protein [Bacillota bacterium]HOS50094.1 cysteine synthase family protein [Bacillota bacterium]HOY90023.1 cysteine synthase family protein [Bacillota bacterium]HPI02167.1 cysteine synthase family protein [Bacillota bacterium]
MSCGTTNSTVIENLSAYIGNTPLLSIEYSYKGKNHRVYAKSENLNMTGSIKDRIAFHVINKAYKLGKLAPGDMIIEATSGNTGISFAAVGRALGHPVTIFMPNWMSKERKDLISSLGARIMLVSKEQGGFLGSIAAADSMAAEVGHAFLPHQFSNPDNPEAHYMHTGPEIWFQMQSRELTPDAFVAGVGTGGTVMGTGRFLKEKNPSIKLYPLEPSNSPTISTGHKVGKHRIQGISDEFIPPVLDTSYLDEVIGVDDGDSIIMAQKLACELGLALGISSGANFLGAVLAQEKLGDRANIVTVFSDDNKKYLSTDLMKEEPVKEGFIAPEVRLFGVDVIKRTCLTCQFQ